jgi:hypothetical protein
VLPAAAQAQTLADYDYENLTFRGIGFDLGYIWPNKVEPAPLWSVRLDLGYLGPAVRIAPSISYWSSRFRRVELDRLADRISELPPLRDQGVVVTADDLGDIQWSDLVLGVDAHIVWTAPLDIITFVGAGVADARTERPRATSSTTRSSRTCSTPCAGCRLHGRLELQLLPGLRIYTEARYTLASDVRYPSIRAGAAVMLPPRQ